MSHCHYLLFANILANSCEACPMEAVTSIYIIVLYFGSFGTPPALLELYFCHFTSSFARHAIWTSALSFFTNIVILPALVHNDVLSGPTHRSCRFTGFCITCPTEAFATTILHGMTVFACYIEVSESRNSLLLPLYGPLFTIKTFLMYL